MNLWSWAILAGMASALSGCGQQGGGQPIAASIDAKRLLAELPAAYHGANLGNGKLRFGLCRSCHTVVQGGADMTGPNLYGVFGRKAATRTGYSYSEVLKTSEITWDADHLDKWLAEPREYLPGTKMTFVGVQDDNDRRDLIAYLKVASSSGPM